MTVHAEPLQPPLARGTLDRSADEREAPGMLERARADDATRVLVLRGDAAPLASAQAPALRLVPPSAVADGAHWALLGRDGSGPAVLLAAFRRGAQEPIRTAHGWAALREIGGALSAFDAGVFVEAASLSRWLLEAPFCPACGAEAAVIRAGWARRCPSCGREHFPRTDPAVIVAVGSTDRERLLLGANARWGGTRFSCFAGFVEAGESLEATVLREVHEEAGVRLAEVRYSGSQAWPYPRSLMVGFHATAIDETAARPDGTEIVEVRWFTRDEIGAALAGEGPIRLPGTSSIARSLIVSWHAGNA